MLVLKLISKIFKILRSGASPGQIAGGFILGMILGLTPLRALHNLVVVLLIILLNVNIAMALFAFAICSGVAYLLDPLSHSIGFWLLVEVKSLHGLWTAIHHVSIIAFSGLNNTVVLGSLLISIILIFPVFLLVKSGVVQYRNNVDAKIQKWKIVKIVKSSKLFSIYIKIKKLGD